MNIELTQAEAVVLSDWLYRNSSKEALFGDLSEQYVMWSIENQLEKALDEPHSPDYLRLLEQARKTVRENY